jgi:hypothetical protein
MATHAPSGQAKDWYDECEEEECEAKDVDKDKKEEKECEEKEDVDNDKKEEECEEEEEENKDKEEEQEEYEEEEAAARAFDYYYYDDDDDDDDDYIDQDEYEWYNDERERGRFDGRASRAAARDATSKRRLR